MPKFNHAFSLGFAVAGSQYENPDDALHNEKDKIICALLTRVQELIGDTAEFKQACEPFDTYEEGK